jgi:Glycosyltransferase WbsX
MTAAHHFFSYFPQFHPDPINNRAWGEGFTDWDLIRALPESEREKFTPSRGYYDPSVPEYLSTLRCQLEALPLPNAGLMVYHYHFDGVSALSGFEKQLLAQPDQGPPIFLCWANETWTKRWVGQPGEVLIEQRHRVDADLVMAHARYLVQFFELPHYHRVDGRPLFMVYDAQASMTLPHVLSMYREAFNALGQNPLIGACLAYPQPSDQIMPYDFGCEFEPRFFFNSRGASGLAYFAARLKMRFPKLFEWLGVQRDRLRHREGGRRFAYVEYLEALADGSIEKALRMSAGSLPLMRSAFLCWDNQARYGDRSTRVAHDGVGADSLMALRSLRSDGGLPLLINSWNEWSEGAALESGTIEHPLRERFLRTLPA